MFNVMAYDKLKAKTQDLNSVVKLQEIVVIWEDCISNLPLSEDYNNLIMAHFPQGQLPDKFHQYLDTVRSVEPSGTTETLDSWILEKFKDFARHSHQEKQKIYLGHVIISRAAHAVAEIKNRMNPLWSIGDIPSGKSLSDMLRAIRFQLFKISQYKLAVEAMKRKVEYKSQLWEEEDKVDYIRADVQTRYEKFVPEFTFPDFWLAFLVCSYPVDHYLQMKKSLPLVVPPMVPISSFSLQLPQNP
jgi:hypothetical protein